MSKWGRFDLDVFQDTTVIGTEETSEWVKRPLIGISTAADTLTSQPNKQA